MTIPAARRAEIMEAVAAGLARGTPLTVICETLQGQGPFTGQSVYNWLKNDPEAKLAIEYARDLGHDWLARECLEIADDCANDVMYDSDGTAHSNGAAVLRARVRIETRLKLLSKWSPRYNDDRKLRVEADLSVTQHHVIDPGSLDDAGRAALRLLLDQVEAQGLLPAPAGEVQDAEYTELSDPDEPA